MGILTKKRYRFGGDFVIEDPDGPGHVRRFHAGDDVPDGLLPQKAIDIHLRNGQVYEVGVKPRRADPVAPQPPTVVDSLRQSHWMGANVVDGRIENGPRGFQIEVSDEPDFKRVMSAGGRDIPVVVHREGGDLIASLSWARLARLIETVSR